jgi:cephalosporin hydroxylase
VIQIPQDIYAMQELAWMIKPDLIIETGIAHGGSLVASASLLALLDYCDAASVGKPVETTSSSRRVVGIDIALRPHNRQAIQSHPLSRLIEIVDGSSTDPAVIERVKNTAKNHERILVFLDSNHSHDHVLAELDAFAPMTSPGSYCVVWDTGIEDFPESPGGDRPWGQGNNPKTAVWEYLRRLQSHPRTAADGGTLSFEIDKTIESKLLLTAAPDGFLRRIALDS